MMTARGGWGVAAKSAAAALAVILLVSAPSAAAAQTYTLTFDNPVSTANRQMSTTYHDTAIPTSSVLITNGIESQFGAGPFTTSTTTNTCSTNSAVGLCFEGGSSPNSGYGESGGGNVAVIGNGVGGTTGQVGVFQFTPQGINVVGSFLGVTVGCLQYDATGNGTGCNYINSYSPNAYETSRIEVQIWNPAGTTELAYYDALFNSYSYNAACACYIEVSQTLTASQFHLISPATSLSDIAGGFRLEWGNILATNLNCHATCNFSNNDGEDFMVDNIVFNVAAVPEPGSLLLLGTGLVGLAPVLLRRRRRNNR